MLSFAIKIGSFVYLYGKYINNRWSSNTHLDIQAGVGGWSLGLQWLLIIPSLQT